MKVQFLLLGLAVFCVAALVGFACLHIAEIPVLHPAGMIALQERSVMIITVMLCSIVVIPVFIILFAFAWRYRAGGAEAKREHEPNWDHDNWVAEAIWWAVPIAIIACLAVVAWKTAQELDPYKPIPSPNAPIAIDVIALDWKWLFIYPAYGIATVNMVEFPADTPVQFNVTADAPMNQFWIPSLGGEIMAMPGMSTQIHLMANATGTFDGRSTEISGDGFAGMTFAAHAVSAADFDAWVASVKQVTNPLDATAYAALAAPSENVPVISYAPIDAGLYTASVMKYMEMGSTSDARATDTMPSVQPMQMGSMTMP